MVKEREDKNMDYTVVIEPTFLSRQFVLGNEVLNKMISRFG